MLNRSNSVVGEGKIKEMNMHKENMERVTKMVAEEVQTLKTQCDRERENAKILKIEAEKVRCWIISAECIVPS
jgi:hypothetical protein